MSDNYVPQHSCEDSQVLALLHRMVAHLSRHVELFGADDADDELFSEYVDLCKSLSIPVCPELIIAVKAWDGAEDEFDVARVQLRLKLKPSSVADSEDLRRNIRPGWRVVEFESEEVEPKNNGAFKSIFKRRSLFQTTILLECSIDVYNKDCFNSEAIADYIANELPLSRVDIENVVVCEAWLDGIIYKVCPKMIGKNILQDK